MAYDLLSIYPAKSMEYGLAIAYLLLFIPFWKYVQGAAKQVEARLPAPAYAAGAEKAARPAHAGARALRPATAGWFQVPAGVHLHPGHTWARLEADGLVSVGADDFAHKLVGPAHVALPRLGDHVQQGQEAFEIGVDGRSVPMISPVDGTVVAVNAAATEKADGLSDPYGASWLFKVKAPRLAANLRQLLEDNAARHFLEEAGERLSMRLSPELGRVLQDGGVPVRGIAQEIEGEKWEPLARSFFLT